MTSERRGIELLVEKYSTNPQQLLKALEGVTRLRRFNDGDIVCRAGENAECLWIVEAGLVAIGEGAKITRRGKGDLVGEMAFYRRGNPARATSMRADGTVKLWVVDRSEIDKMAAEDRALWLALIAAVLSEKLIEAVENREYLLRENVSLDLVLKRFVCEDGVSAVNGAFGDQHIVPDNTVALLWFSDLAGFSTYSRDLPALNVAEQIRRLMEIQVDEIHKAGGEIDKFMGDGLMAFWRVPDQLRLEDRIPRAAQAALNAVDRIKAIVSQEGLALGIRIGLHYGPVVIGDFGGKDRIAYTLLGETVNSASRYEQAQFGDDGQALGNVRLSEGVFSQLRNPELLAKFDQQPRQFTAKQGRTFRTYTSLPR